MNVDNIDNITTDARIEGVSLKLIESTINRPTPGHANMDSVTTDPPNSPPKLIPITVKIGMRALGSICLTVIVDSFNPLALAVSI